jgi:hypothetical protein
MSIWSTATSQTRTFTRQDGTKVTANYEFVAKYDKQEITAHEKDGASDKVHDELIVPVPPKGKFTTISDIAYAVLQQNAASPSAKDVQALVDQLITLNALKDAFGRECDGVQRNNAMIWPGQVLKLPDNALTYKDANDYTFSVTFRSALECDNIKNYVDQKNMRDVLVPIISLEKDILGLIKGPDNQHTTQTLVVKNEQQQRVALVRYPNGGNLGEREDGTVKTTEIQDAINMMGLMGHQYAQADVAARGINKRRTNSRTFTEAVDDLGGKALEKGGPLLLTANVGGVILRPFVLSHTWGSQSADRIMNARQGSGAVNQDDAGKDFGFDVFGRSKFTKLGGTLLPGLGINMSADGRITDDPTSPHNNNQVYYGAQRDGADLPNMTFAARDLDDPEFRNGRLSRRPSDAVGLYGLSNYGLAQYVYNDLNAVKGQVNPALGRVEQHDGEVTILTRKIADGSAKEQDYQRYVNLMRFQQELVGFSNYDITSQDVIQDIIARDRTLASLAPDSEAYKQLSESQERRIGLLNPREQLELKVQQIEILAKDKGFSVDTNVKGDDLTGADYPVRSLTREALREQLIEYYTVMAVTQETAFKQMVARETKGVVMATRDRLAEEHPDWTKEQVRQEAERLTEIEGRKWRPENYNEKDARLAYMNGSEDPEHLEALRKAEASVERFVDEFTILKEFPEKGVSFEHLDHLFRLPVEKFNSIERFAKLPEKTAGRESLKGAGELFAGSPALTKILLEATQHNPDLAQAIAYFDDGTIQRPNQYGMGGWSRNDELERFTERGYREELMGSTWSRRPSQGIVRDFALVREDLAASANNDAAIAARQEDWRLMVTAGTAPDNDHGVLVGQHMEDVLYALAAERGNKTLTLLEEKIREENPDNANALIESLRQGVSYARNQRMENRLGTSHDDLQSTIHRQELGKDALLNQKAAETMKAPEGAKEISAEKAAEILKNDVTSDGKKDGIVTQTKTLVNQQNRENNLTKMLNQLAAEDTDKAKGGADGVAWLAKITNSDPKTLMGDLQQDHAKAYEIFNSLTEEQRAQVLYAGNVATSQQNAAEIWSRVQAEQVITNQTVVLQSDKVVTRSQNDAAYIDAFSNKTGIDRTTALLQLYMNDPLTKAYAAKATTNESLLFVNKAFASEVVAANQKNAEFISAVREGLTGGKNAKDAFKAIVDDAVIFTDSAGKDAFTVEASLRDAHPAIQAWIKGEGAEIYADLVDKAVQKNFSNPRFERQLRRAIRNSVEDVEAFLGASDPAFALANILEGIQNGDENAAQQLAGFIANPANDAAVQSLVTLVATHDANGFAGKWQSVIDAYAANPDADVLALVANGASDAKGAAATRDLVLAALTKAIAEYDATNTLALSASTQHVLHESPTIPNGFYVPFLILPTGYEGKVPRVPRGGPLDVPVKPTDIPIGPPVKPTQALKHLFSEVNVEDITLDGSLPNMAAGASKERLS